MDFAEMVTKKFDKLKQVFIDKNGDYGNSVEMVPVLAPTVRPDEAVRVRISDKINRLNSLLSGKRTAKVHESIVDTMEDTAVYFIILACLWEKYMVDPLAPMPPMYNGSAKPTFDIRKVEAIKTENDDTSDYMALLEEMAKMEPGEIEELAKISEKDKSEMKCFSLDQVPGETVKDVIDLQYMRPFVVCIRGMPHPVRSFRDVIIKIYESLELTNKEVDRLIEWRNKHVCRVRIAKDLDSIDCKEKPKILWLGNVYIDISFDDFENLEYLIDTMKFLNKSTSGIVVYYMETDK